MPRARWSGCSPPTTCSICSPWRSRAWREFWCAAPRAESARSGGSGSQRQRPEPGEIGFGQGFLLEQQARAALELRSLALEDAARLVARRGHDLAHREVDLARGLLAVFPASLEYLIRKKRGPLVLVGDVAQRLHH